MVGSYREMSFNYKPASLNWTGGYNVTGYGYALARTYYFAEGCTTKDRSSQFNTWMLVINPGVKTASVDMAFMRSDGVVIPWSIAVPPHSRFSLPVDNVPGMENASFSTMVTSDADILVERSMFFDCSGMKGGHNDVGRSILNPAFGFRDNNNVKSSDSRFSEYLLLQNPGTEPVTVDVKYTVDPAYGADRSEVLVVPPHSRVTKLVDETLPSAVFKMDLATRDKGEIAAERAVYYDVKGVTGGHVSVGIPWSIPP
jgi:hypothetical protein